ncbi:protein C-mannosyl-transferase DPY19L1-like [Amphiura filiformis]|uniref:protein C-mannosyl-transferase DPY19L1-like n=1 Tax=Amphiura filiformis TaxID=82378 RepID=UPI003B21E1A1
MAARNKKQTSTGSAQKQLQKAQKGKSKGGQRFHKDAKSTPSSGTWRKKMTGWHVAAVIIAVTAGVLHCMHVSNMFENDRFFSHLSELEREMTFRTEMGLYYSYYKTMITSPTFVQGLSAVMNDNVTEYPSTINVLKRFNLYPEVGLAMGYRIFRSVTESLNIRTKQCYRVERGRGLSAVSNCEGIGDPAYFYIDLIFVENGALMSLVFILATNLSGSLMGGIIAVLTFFYNHGECTRVQWTPPLRESFAYPILLLQILIVTHTLKTSHPGWKHSIAIALTTVGFMLPWQFAQFALLTQTLAIFATYVLGYIGSNKFRCIIQGQSIGLVISFVMLFGNEMLLTSFFASCLITVWIIVLLEKHIEKLPHRLLIWIVQGLILILGVVGIKIILSKLLSTADDAHISNLFRSKFSDFRDFHTMLYICAKEFDFIESETPIRFLKTLLLPASVIALGGVVVHLCRLEYNAWKAGHDETEENAHEGKNGSNHEENNAIQERSKPHAELVYHVFQLLAFTVMGIIIMRLKLFMTPHLCIFCGILASSKVFGFFKDRNMHNAVLAGMLALMSIGGIANLRHQWSIQGDFSNAPQEEMLEWVKANVPQDAVFAGPMPTMATIKLSTLRPIVNHPHYEDVGLRARVKTVYEMYSRKPAAEVYAHIKALQAQYVVMEDSWCTRKTRDGCSLPEIFDLEDKENLGKEPLCMKLKKNPAPYFKQVFRNNVYTILKL